MKKNLFILLLLFLCGCAKEPVTETNPETGQGKGIIMTMDEIQTLAIEAPSVFSDIPETRAGLKKIREVRTMEEAVAANTRAGSLMGDMENVYVVDYENDEGFVIVSADRRVGDVLAYTDNGSFETALSNPGVELFLSGLSGYIEEQVSSYNPVDTAGEDWYVDQLIFLYTVNSQVGPYVGVKWGQSGPFNYFVTVPCTSGNNKAPLGCTNTAGLTAMSYWSQPTRISGTVPGYVAVNDPLNWDYYRNNVFGWAITNDVYRLSISLLAYFTATSNSTDFACDGSGASIDDLRKTMVNKYGYKSDGYADYNYNQVIADLNNRRPVIAAGWRPNDSGGKVGHAWVIDGYKYYQTTYEIFRRWYSADGTFLRYENAGTTNDARTITHVHCNWGWEGSSDGYFVNGAFLGFDLNMKMIKALRY